MPPLETGKVMAAGMYWAAEDAALICGGLECLEAEESGGVQTQKCYTFNAQDGQWRETFELDVLLYACEVLSFFHNGGISLEKRRRKGNRKITNSICTEVFNVCEREKMK